MAVARIAPLILRIGPAGIEAVIVGLVGEAPVVAVEFLRERSTDRTAVR